MKKLVLLIAICLGIIHTQAQTFTNPLLPSGPDPYNFFKDGYYYYTNSTGSNVTIWKTKSIADLKSAEKKVIWKAPATGPYSKEIWAPEILFLRGKWYAYFAADDGDNNNHRMYVIENASQDPMQGAWVFKGQIKDATNKWAIDGDVFEHKGQLYMIWAGWEGNQNGQQDIYIAKMKNPWTIDGPRVKLSSPELPWETQWKGGPQVLVNEGPQFLKHGDNLFIVYSASGCWTDHYALGLLSTKINADLMNPKSWTKAKEPILQTHLGNGIIAPGHNSFFKSPDGKEDWILYHANSELGQGCGNHRSPRAQKITWDAKGFPVIGEPIKAGVEIPLPSGTK